MTCAHASRRFAAAVLAVVVSSSGCSEQLSAPIVDGSVAPDAGERATDAGASVDASDSGASSDAAADASSMSEDAGPTGRASAGCGPMAADVGVFSGSLTIAGVERTYLASVPESYDPSTPLPLVFGLHGAGGNASGIRERFALEMPAAGGAIFVYPQALVSESDGRTRWNEDAGSDDYAFFDRLLATFEETHCIDRDRIFVAGFSAGATFAANLGCWRGDVLRAIAPVAPGGRDRALPLTECVGSVGVWTGVGTLDSDHQYGSLRVRDHYASANGCASTRTPTSGECESYDGCRADAPVIWCSYELGHRWPPFGGAAIWAFFDGFE